MSGSSEDNLSATTSQSQNLLSQVLGGILTLKRQWSTPTSMPQTITNITNASAPAQQSDLVPSQQASSSHFQHARNVGIHGGQFTTELAPRMVTNFTINIPQLEHGGRHPPIVPETSTLHQDEQVSHEVEIGNSRSMPSADGEIAALGSNLTSQSSLTTMKCHEVYRSLLEPKRPGYALWIPAPSKNLPVPYQREGVQIGDVGIITPDGNFSFLFNICVPRDDPINPRSLPEEFSPIDPPIDPIDIRKLVVFQAGSYLASTSIEKCQDDIPSPRGLCFRVSGSKGAILTMPDGATSQDLENLPIFRKYVAANVKRWYRYINGPRGREAKNGDVRLVVGCDKATSWGMAALSNVAKHGQLKFKPLDAQSSSSSSCGYTWEYSGTVDVKVGPDQKEIDELRREDPDHPDRYLNQCLFVRTLNVTLNDEDWENLNQGIEVGDTPNSFVAQETGMPFRLPGNRGAPSDGTRTTSTVAGGHGTQRSTGGSSGISLNRLDISVPQTATSCHPSRVINEILLKKVPTAKMVITHDEDWYSCIQEDMTMSSDPEQILASILIVNDLREENGVVYLEPKVTREMKYFADLERLSIELKQNSSNLEEYLCGVDPCRSARWNEIVFLLELCRDALLASSGHADNKLSRNSLPDTRRIREIETLIGSLLIDELFLDEPDAFASIYTLRSSSQALKPFSSSFRRDTSQKLSLILGRNSTNLNTPTKPQMFVPHLDAGGLLRTSSNYYLHYLASGEPSYLKYTIESLRKQIRATHVTRQKDQNPSTSDPHRTVQHMPSGRWTHSGRDTPPPPSRPIYAIPFSPSTFHSPITTSDFSNTKRSEISGRQYLAPQDSPATFFKSGKGLRITGGKYGDSYPTRQSMGRSEAYQDNFSAYGSRERKGLRGSILAKNQVENDPESYDTDEDEPDIFQRETSNMEPPPTGRNPYPTPEGLYSHPPRLSMAQVTTGYQSTGPPPPRGQTVYHSSTGSPNAWTQDYQSARFPEPRYPASHDAISFGYPSPQSSQQGSRPRRGSSQPLQEPSSSTSYIARDYAPPANIPLLYEPPTGTATTTIPQNPYGRPYSPLTQYDASMHHGGQPSFPVYTPASQPSNYPSAHDNYYQKPPAPSREDGPPFPPSQNTPGP